MTMKGFIESTCPYSGTGCCNRTTTVVEVEEAERVSRMLIECSECGKPYVIEYHGYIIDGAPRMIQGFE